jgi:organic radical activating enzyme
MQQLTEILGDTNTVVVDWTLSNICNYTCHYCTDDAKNGSQIWPEFESIRKTVRKLSEHYKGKTLSFVLLGGELTVWKQFIDCITIIKEEAPSSKIRLLTNGIMPPKWWATYGLLFDSVQFSFHPNQVKSLDVFIESVNQCSCKDNNVFIMADPKHWDIVTDAYEQCVNRITTARSIAAKVVDNRNVMITNSIIDYTVEQKEWIVKSLKSNINIPKKISVIKGIDIDGNIEILNPVELITNGNNKWKYWKCSVGIEKITLHGSGNITRGSACVVGPSYGNWRNDTFLPLPTDWVTCPYDACFCGADINVSRRSPIAK